METSQCEPVYRDAKSPNTFQAGMEFQDFVCSQLAKEGIILQNLVSKKYQYEIGENLQGFEIKKDDRCTDTNRLSIEMYERTANDPAKLWVPSGIQRSDNTWLYIQGNYKIIFIFSKRFLLRFFEIKKPALDEKYGTIRTFYLPFEDARKNAAKVIEF